MEMLKCPQCQGGGYVTHALGEGKCSVCKGTGYIEQAARATPADQVEMKLRRLMGAINSYEKATGIGGWYAEQVQEASNSLLKALGSEIRFGLGDENPIAASAPKGDGND
jgi:hypothetical protein